MNYSSFNLILSREETLHEENTKVRDGYDRGGVREVVGKGFLPHML